MYHIFVKHPELLTKNDTLKSTCEISTYESIDACNLLHKTKFKYWNKNSFFKLSISLLGLNAV